MPTCRKYKAMVGLRNRQPRKTIGLHTDDRPSPQNPQESHIRYSAPGRYSETPSTQRFEAVNCSRFIRFSRILRFSRHRIRDDRCAD